MRSNLNIFHPCPETPGEPFAVCIVTALGERITVPCQTKAEAIEIHADALADGFHARIFGLPSLLTISAVVPIRSQARKP